MHTVWKRRIGSATVRVVHGTATALLCALLGIAAAATAAQQPQTAPDTPRSPSPLRISVDLIQVDAVVTDDQGRHVRDLDAGDFEVLQDGRPQTISAFAYMTTAAVPGSAARTGPAAAASATAPSAAAVSNPGPAAQQIASGQVRRTMALVVDDINLSFESTTRVRNALRRFIDNDMREGDLVAILRTGAGMGALQQFTTDRRQLHAAVDRVRWNMVGQIPSFSTAELDQRVELYEKEFFAAGTLGALQYVIRGVAQLPGRKSIILLTDGFRLTDADSKYGRVLDMLKGVADSANRAGVVIYGIDLRGLVSRAPTAYEPASRELISAVGQKREELRSTQESVDRLSYETGGLFIRDSNDIAAGVRRVLDDQQGYYLLGYTPEGATFSVKDPKFHMLTVRVKRRGLHVRSRLGFLGRPDAQPRQTPASRMIAAVTSPFAGGDIPLRLTSFYGEASTGGPVMQSVMHVNPADLTFTQQPDGTRIAQLEIMAMTFGDNGEVADSQSRRYTVNLTSERYAKALETGFVYTMQLPIKRPGPYQLRIALRDAATDRIGSASQFIDVPNVKKGGLILSSVFVQGGDPNETLAVRRFRQGSQANYFCSIYNATRDKSRQPQLESEVRLLRDGVEVFRSRPQPVTSMSGTTELSAAGAVQLGAATPPGSYVLQISVSDRLATKRARATQTIDFEIIDK